MGRVICKELCKRLKFDHTTKWYLQKPESVIENETHYDFEIQTDLLIPLRRSNRVVIDKSLKKRKEKEN